MINKLINNLKKEIDIHTYEVIVKSSKTMLVKSMGMISGLFVSIFIANILGPEGLGVVNFANKLGYVLLIFCLFGFQNVVVKNVAIGKAENKDSIIVNSLKTSLIFNFVLCILISIICFLLLQILSHFVVKINEIYIPLTIVFIMIIPQTISRVLSAVLNGLGKIWQSNLIDETLTPIFVCLGLIFFYFLDFNFSVVLILVLYAVCRFVVLIVVTLLLKSNFKSRLKGKFELKPMLKIAKPMMLISGTGVIASNLDTLMLAALDSFDQVGIYTVALKLAFLTSFFLHVTNTAISPKLAGLFHQSKISEMNLMVQRITKILSIFALLFLLFFIFFGHTLLNIWGPEFSEGYWILLVLVIGQFFNISTGCSGLLLLMCGFEKIHAKITFYCLIFNLVLNFILILNFGAIGAAIATALTLIIENIFKVVYSKIKIGILTLPL